MVVSNIVGVLQVIEPDAPVKVTVGWTVFIAILIVVVCNIVPVDAAKLNIPGTLAATLLPFTIFICGLVHV